MMSAGFQCKKFYIAHHQCAMKVGTDGLLLGAWAPLPHANCNILDIGAGSGLISLMLAQRTAGANAIDAVELDIAAATQASENIANSPWPNAVTLLKGDILTYHSDKRYRLIVSNPPFFENALPARDEKRHQARHTTQLPFVSLLDKAFELLDDDGLFALILPADNAALVIALAASASWYLVKYTEVYSVETKPVRRILFCLAKKPAPLEKSTLVIQDKQGYSEQYRDLLRDFYLAF